MMNKIASGSTKDFNSVGMRLKIYTLRECYVKIHATKSNKRNYLLKKEGSKLIVRDISCYGKLKITPFLDGNRFLHLLQKEDS